MVVYHFHATYHPDDRVRQVHGLVSMPEPVLTTEAYAALLEQICREHALRCSPDSLVLTSLTIVS